jgi:hypothetical protein
MEGESNNHNRVEESLQLLGSGAARVIDRIIGGRFLHTTITAHDYFASQETKNKHWGVTLAGKS